MKKFLLLSAFAAIDWLYYKSGSFGKLKMTIRPGYKKSGGF